MGRSLSARSRRITASGKAFLQNDASTTGDASRFYNKGGHHVRRDPKRLADGITFGGD